MLNPKNINSKFQFQNAKSFVYRFAQTVTYFIGDSSQARNDKFFQLETRNSSNSKLETRNSKLPTRNSKLETRNFQLRNYHLAKDSLKISCVIRSKITSKAVVSSEPINC